MSRIFTGEGCQAKHESHARHLVNVRLEGQPIVHEYPAVPAHLAKSFSMWAYDWRDYMGFRGFCPGQDETSMALDLNKTWEGFETILALDIFRQGDRRGTVLDFGAHIGWYSVLAGLSGYEVIAFEGDPTHAATLEANLVANGLAAKVAIIPAPIQSDMPVLPADGDVEFLKADVEGMEDEVVRVCAGLFESRRIRYALLEISPCFEPHYPDTVERIAAWGYEVYDVPSKACSNKAEFEASPLDAIRRHRLQTAGRREYVAGLRQSNFLFVRADR